MGDFRVEWVKGKSLKFMEEINGQLFDDMLAEDGGQLWHKMISFLNDDILGSQDVSRRLFFLYKTYYEKLVHEELVATEDVTSSPPSTESEEEAGKREPPSPGTKKKLKGRKGVAQKGSGKIGKEVKDAGKVKQGDKKGATREENIDRAVVEEVEGTAKDGTVEKVTDTGQHKVDISTEGESTVEEETDGVDTERETDEEAPKKEETKDEGEIADDTVDGKESKSEVGEETKTEEVGKDRKKMGVGKKKEGAKGKGSRKGNGKAGKRGRKSPTTLVELIPEPEEKLKPEPAVEYVKRILHKVVQAPRLHAQFGHVPSDELAKNRRYVYFLRSCQEGIPFMESVEDAEALMPRNFIIGSCTGRCLHDVRQLLTKVYVPLIECQFRDPTTLGESEWEMTTQANGMGLSGSKCSFRRPSDFRRLSIVAKKILSKKSETQSARKREKEFGPAYDAVRHPIKKALLDETNQLISAIEWTIRHVEGDTMLHIPYIAALHQQDTSVQSLAKDSQLKDQLEEVVMSWERHVTAVIDSYLTKKPVGQGPLPEYDYWYEREAGLAVLAEELKSPMVVQIFEILHEGGSRIAEGFARCQDDLLKCYMQARDNVKFLSTILRHVQTITHSDILPEITETLYPLMEGLHMLWLLSRFYCKGEQMVPLMERIAWMLCSQAKTHLQLRDIFKNPMLEIPTVCTEAIKMLRTWKDAYCDTRLEIEKSGKEEKWEFDKNKLFKETDYIAAVASDLFDMAQLICHYNNVFGPGIKSITNDPSQIDAVVKTIERLVTSVSQVGFDVFDQKFELDWREFLGNYNLQVSGLETEAKCCIDESFNVLRSSEETLELLLKFKHIETAKAIQEQLTSKYGHVMKQFMNEILSVQTEFDKRKQDPPLLRNHPPIAGAIFWSRFLFDRLKRRVLTFQKVEELKNSSLKEEAFGLYLKLAQQMKTYEDKKFSQWQRKSVSIVASALKKNVLKVVERKILKDLPTTRKPSNGSVISPRTALRMQKSRRRTDSTFSGSSAPSSAAASSPDTQRNKPERLSIGAVALTMKWVAKARGKSSIQIAQRTPTFGPSPGTQYMPAGIALTWGEMMRGSVLVEKDLCFETNRLYDIFAIIAESELMEQLGFALEPTIRSVTVQKDRLRRDLEAIQNVINEYNTVVESLTIVELQFLKDHILEVERHIQPGLTRFNWNSLGIAEYGKDCGQVLKNLTSLVTQKEKIRQELQAKIDCAQNFDFFYYEKSDEGSGNLCCKAFFVQVEKFRRDNLSIFLQIYRGLGPLLMKLESLVLQTNTGQSGLMTLCYEFWEKKMFNTLIRLVVKNLKYFNDLLFGKVALFQVDTALAIPDVVLCPAANDVYNCILSSVRDFIEKLKSVPRWMNGSCLECIPVKFSDSDELYTFSFFEDVIPVQAVNDVVLSIRDSARRLVAEVQKYLQRWKKYRSLWTFNKNVTCDRFSAKNPTLLQYDEKLLFYERLVTDIDEMDTYCDIYCIRVNLIPIIEAVKFHANEWKRTLGIRLAENTKKLMLEFRDLLVKLDSDVQAKIDDLEGFKFVLTAIRTITGMSVNAELTYREMQERYHTLRQHKVPAPDEDDNMSREVQSMWEALYMKALNRSFMLKSTKARYAKITVEEIDEFVKIVEEVAQRFEDQGPVSVGQDLDSGLKLMDEYRTLLRQLEERRLHLVNAEILFDLPITDYSRFIKCRTDMEGLEQIYSLYKEQKAAREVWAKTLWMNLNAEVLLDGMERFIGEFRRYKDWVKQLRVGQILDAHMKEFKNSVPLFNELKNEALRERHWEELMDKTDQHFDMSPDRFTLENLFAMQLHRYQNVVQEIIANAVKELDTERGVKKIEEVWKGMQFTVIKHFKRNDDRCFMMGPVDDILVVLEDNSVQLQCMAASQFIGPFLPAVQKWEKTLSLISDVLDEWLSVQSKWLCVGEIFVGGDIRQQLPDAARKFDDIDKAFQKMMLETAKKPNVKDCCGADGRLKELRGLSCCLQKCQKSLNDYLNSKRIAFPRFIFISDDELLSILGNSDPSSVQEHMVKMFDNISSLRLEADSHDRPVASAIISSEGEAMEFREAIVAVGRVEDWMNAVVEGMRVATRYGTKKAIFDYGKLRRPRTQWMLDYQDMVSLAATQVWWTAEVENVFEKVNQGKNKAMKEYLEFVNKQVDELVTRLRSHLSKNDRRKFSTVLVVDVHARDVIEVFVRESILKAQEFEWEIQLKYYWWKPANNLVVRQCTGSFDYGYEYMGLNGRLVVTPLTERIYLTVTQALSMQLGSVLTGPAGTGKTETVKDLAKAFGLLCVVTNCSDGMDCKTLGKILCGLCQCGAWGCFDEFQRLDASVLSALSTQLQAIRSALLHRSKRCNFEGQEIALDSKVGVFVTMNSEYAGRIELLASVKALFRPMVCIVPDLEIIGFTLLFCEGFLQAKVLAKKLVALYKLAQEQLSQQNHYDFGLRALKAVLVKAGELKRGSPDLPENVILMMAVRDTNLPKFVCEDVPLFLGLTKDLFPGLECPRVGNPNFEAAVETALAEEGYVVLPAQVEKVAQTYEMVMTRHCTMVVGPSGGGKTVVIQTLARAQTSLGLTTKLFVLNPKACSVTELYGIVDPLTRDWTDGLLSRIFRDINKPTDKEERRYILFDGDVDPLWIENMNSVMDDNKVLTLANGERIGLQNHCALLFEVGNLQYASPATVSRAGMVYIDPKNSGYKPYWDRWLKSRTGPDERVQLEEMFVRYVDPQIKYIFEGQMGLRSAAPLKTVVPQTELNMVTQLCFMIDALIPAQEDPSKQVTGELLECLFLEALYCSLGASLNAEGRFQFDEYTKNICGMMKMEDTLEQKAAVGHLPVSQPTLYDYHFDDRNQCWMAWKWMVPEYVHDTGRQLSEILVPTVDTVKTTWLLKLMNEAFFRGHYFHKVKRPVVLVGETGTSKSAIILDFLRHLNPDVFMTLNINFCSTTTTPDLQRNLESILEKRAKDTYGPVSGKKLLCFIDDLNMPQVDEYGTQKSIALLKFLFERGGVYGRGKDLEWKNIKDIGFFAAMGKAGGGKNELDPRFMSKLSIFNVTVPCDETVRHIYRSILAGHAGNFAEEIRTVVPVIVEATLGLYKAVITEFPATPSKFHYTFSFRDLSRIWAGMLLTTPDCVKTAVVFVRVWRNEFTRVVCDRLITEQDQKEMNELMKKRIYKHFPEDQEFILRDPLLFGDYSNAMNEGRSRIYEDLLDYDAIYYLFQEILEEHNKQHNRLNLVLFDDVLEHLTRVHRVLRMHKGHIMIVGEGGSGKQTILRLAAFTAGCGLFQITLSRGYNGTSFKKDLKKLYNLIGVQRKPTVFLLTAAQIVAEGFLELINNMLITGMVPTLFSEHEKEQICESIRNASKEAEFGATREGVWRYFTAVCSNNLHVGLCLSPSGDILRNLYRSFPGLVNNTSIDWLFPWPPQALTAVANVFLAENPKIPEPFRMTIVEQAVYVHCSIRDYTQDLLLKLRRKTYVTPRHYLDFIHMYLRLLDEKDSYMKIQCEHLTGGITKILEASEKLNELKAKLEIQKTAVAEQTATCEKLLVQVEEATANAGEKKTAATLKSIEMEEQSKIISAEKAEAEATLAEALLGLETARLALGELDESDITAIRSFDIVPEPVIVVCECVAIIMGYTEVDWEVAKGIMAEPNFLQNLQGVNCDLITGTQIRATKTHMKKSQDLDDMAQISKAGHGLLKFVETVVAYCGIYREVKPKRDRVAQMEREFEQASRDLNKLRSDITFLDEDLKALGLKCEGAVKDRQLQLEEMDVLQRHHLVADKLISGLSAENSRWTEELANLKSERERLVGDCLISASFLSYTGAFSWEFRRRIVYEDWEADLRNRNVPLSKPFRLETTLANDPDFIRWISEGLPADELSVQNAILTTRASRSPLFIDPQQQAVQWIRKKEANQNLKVVTFNDTDFLKHLEMTINYGYPILFEDVDDFIDPVIENVLDRDIKVRGEGAYIALGDKEVECNPNFRMYLATRLPNPVFNSALYAKVNVIDCTVTALGLEDQLLSLVVNHERFDLEEQREKLIAETFENKNLLKNLEDTVLRGLSTSTGDILNNTELLETLEETKRKAAEVATKLELCSVTAKSIDMVRNGYRPAAKRGAILFFVLSDMTRVNSMYQYSLSAYMEVLTASLRKATPDATVSRRVTNVINTFTKSFYDYGCTGIFEKHKLLFSFQMTIKLQQSHGIVKQEEIDFFIKGSDTSIKSENGSPVPWIAAQGWEDIMKLSTSFPDTFEKLPNDIQTHINGWKEWFDLDQPETSDFPSGYTQKTKNFQKLMLLRCFRVDRAYRAVINYISEIMGEEYVRPPFLSLDAIFEQSKPTTPVVFITSPASDAIVELVKLAERSGFGGSKFCSLCLGQGQELIALNMLKVAVATGQWIVLQNCHFLLAFLRTLEKELEQTSEPHREFRLWITADPTPGFPVGILQRSLKVVTEPPHGLKMKLRSTYCKLSNQTLKSCRHPAFRSLVYVLAFFHAVVQERRNYGKTGWNICYDFNESDFNACVKILGTYLTKSLEAHDSRIPWGSLKYLIGEVIYGGRVLDDFDRRILRTYMNEYMGDFLFDTFQPFHFYCDQSVDFVILNESDKDGYINSIERLPVVHSPEVFGLHPNCEISYCTQGAADIWNDLLELQPKRSENSGDVRRDEFIDNAAKDIIERIPPPYDVARTRRIYELKLIPTITVLLQEMERFNLLLETMRQTLELLRKALAGEIGIDAVLESVACSLFNGELPDVWRKFAPATCKRLGAWMDHFEKRIEQYTIWVASGDPMVMWLSGLHAPESFLAALVQIACRKNGWPLDRSTSYTRVTTYMDVDDVDKRPDQGCLIRGLYLEGARWDKRRGCLARSHPKVLLEELPLLLIVPTEVHRLKLQNTLRTPVYTTSQRRNALGVGPVFLADLDIREHESHWILQGVCLTLNTD